MCIMRKNSCKRGNKSSTFIYENNISENKQKCDKKNRTYSTIILSNKGTVMQN